MKKPLTSFLLRISISSAVIATIAGAAAHLFFSTPATVSTAAGWISSLASVLVLSITVTKSFCGKCAQNGIAVVGIVILAAIGAALWLMISKGYADPLFFMIGFSTTVISLLFEMMRVKRNS